MQLSKLGALAALGAMLAVPAMAQGSYQGSPQWRGGTRNQAMNTPSGWQGGYGNSGQGSYGGNFGPGGQNGTWQGGGYGPNENIPRAGNFPQQGFGPGQSSQYGQGGFGAPGHWSNREIAAREIIDLRRALEQAGFSHIRVLPESFLVRAMDRQGHRVLMLISPNSVEEMIAINQGQGGQGQGGMTMPSPGMRQGNMNRGNMNPGNMAGNYGQYVNPNDLTGNRE